jgi:hypothetical protein
MLSHDSYRAQLTPTRQNIAELGMKIEELRVIVSGNHQGVEYAVGRSPSVHRLQMETPGPLNVDPESEYQNPRGTTDSAFEDIKLDPELESDCQKPPSTTESAFEDTKSTTSSSERVAISYWRYHATMSNFAKESLSWHDDELTDDAASLRGLAPSTIRASHRSREEDNPSDRQSTISAVSNSSWTRKWLETQLSPEETAKTLRRMQSTISSQISSCETGNSIVASDMQTFLQYIRYFMPVLAEFDAEEKAVQNDKQPSENESYFSDCNIEEEDTQNEKQSKKADTTVEDNDIIAQGSSMPIEPTADEVTSHLAEVFDRAGEPVSPVPEAGSETTNGTSWDIQSNIHGYSTPRTGLSLSREESDPYCHGDREERTGPTTSGGEEGTPRNFVEESGAETRGMGGKAVSIPHTISGFSIYVEKRPHRRGTVICTADANNALRVSHSFSQALTAELQASGTYASVPNTTKGGHSDMSKQNQPLLFFVQQSTHRCVPPKESQDLGSESESEDFSATRLAQGHMEGPVRIIRAVPPRSKEKEIKSRRPSIKSVPSDFD